MRLSAGKIIPLVLTAVLLTMFAACSGGMGTPNDTGAPAGSPAATERASSAPSEASVSGSPEAIVSPETSGEASAAPDASEAASGAPSSTERPEGSEKTDLSALLGGFMEGAVVDPDDAPELIRLLSSREEYRDMTVQSITYRTFEERRAFYVVLQGEGEASHPLYVFEDGTIRDAD